MTGSRAEVAVTWGLGVALGLGFLLAVADPLVGGLLESWRSTGRSVPLAHAAVVTAAGSAWLGAVVALGPMARSARDLAWRPGPPRRRPFLARYAGCSAVVAATAATTLVVMPLGADGKDVAAGVAATAGLLSLSAVAWCGQLASARDLLVAVARAAGLAALALLCWSTDEHVLGALVGLGAAASLAIGLGRTSLVRPGAAPPRWSLVRAAEQRWALTASLVLLDGSIARQARDRWTGRPAVRGGSWRTPWPDLTRTLLLVTRLVPRTAAACVVAGVLAHVLAPWSTTTAAAFVGLAMAAHAPRASVQADHWADAPALSRTFAATRTLTVLLAPVAALLLMALVGIAAAPPSMLQAVVLITLAPALVLRRRQGRLASSDALLATPFGPVMVAQLERFVAGWDVAALAVVLVALA